MAAPLTGPVALVATTCAADLGAAPSGQRPPAADKAADKQWVQGCEAGYHQDHPHQLVQDGVMYGKGARPCTGACESRSYAAGKSTALATLKLPGFVTADTSDLATSTWCGNLLADRLSPALPASVEALLRAGLPAPGPAVTYWDRGCGIGFGSVVPLASNNGVTAAGAFGAAPSVTIPARRAASSLYVKTLIQGTGATVTSADGMVDNYVAYDWSGTTHKLIASSYHEGSPTIFVGKLLVGLEQALVGRPAGSRVLAVLPPVDAYGGAGNKQLGVGGSDTLVFVIDINSAFATAGVPGTQMTDGGGTLPTVTPPAAGSTAGPTITIPSQVTPPGTLQVVTLIGGAGAVVEPGQTIAVQYTGVIWRTGQDFSSSWTSGTSLAIPLKDDTIIKGWVDGLAGQAVGSCVLLVVPPADGYGSAGLTQSGITGTDTLVFVVDILAVN